MLAISRNIIILVSAGLMLLLVGCGEADNLVDTNVVAPTPTVDMDGAWDPIDTDFGPSGVGGTDPLDSDGPQQEEAFEANDEAFDVYNDLDTPDILEETIEEGGFDDEVIPDVVGEAGDNIDVYVEDGTDIVETGEGYDPSLDVEEVVPIATPMPTPTPTSEPIQIGLDCSDFDLSDPDYLTCLALELHLEDYQVNLCNMNPNLQERALCYRAASTEQLLDTDEYTDAMEDLIDSFLTPEPNYGGSTHNPMASEEDFLSD